MSQSLFHRLDFNLSTASDSGYLDVLIVRKYARLVSICRYLKLLQMVDCGSDTLNMKTGKC